MNLKYINKLNSLRYFIADAVKSLIRNRTLSLAAAATLSSSLFILGIFLMTMLNVKTGIDNVQSKIEIKVFLKDNLDSSSKSRIEQSLKSIEGVKEVTFESKTEALQKFTNQLAEKDRPLLEGYNNANNPMPDSYIVRLERPTFVQAAADKAVTFDGVESVGNDREFVNKIISFSNILKWVGVAVFILLMGVSIFLIGNTIKLTVFSRRREINIMKFVGATDWFIRWPFIIEGAIIGVLGSLISALILFYLYKVVYIKITASMLAAQLLSPSYVLTAVLWEFLVAGVLIGSLGSFLAVKKHLVV